MSDYEQDKQQPVWKGEGLPPVGTVCEIMRVPVMSTGWFDVEILAYNKEQVWVRILESGNSMVYDVQSMEFRPIRTEKERIVGEMVNLRAAHMWTDTEFCEAIYEQIIKPMRGLEMVKRYEPGKTHAITLLTEDPEIINAIEQLHRENAELKAKHAKAMRQVREGVKEYNEQMEEAAQREIAELLATVEALRGQMERFGLGIDEFHRNICNKLVSKTPAQHLNDLKANVVNECADSFGDRPIDYGEIKEYARKQKQ